MKRLMNVDEAKEVYQDLSKLRSIASVREIGMMLCITFSITEAANYNFGYDVNDHIEGTDFGHHEERRDESAHGEYHVVLPDGRKQTVSYEADERGFKPRISYEEMDDDSDGGYDSNAKNLKTGNGRESEGYGGGHLGKKNGNGLSNNGRKNGY